MPKLSFVEIDRRVYENSLNTCHYVSGYENRSSEILVRCEIHGTEFYTKYENVGRATRKHHICPQCKEEDHLERSGSLECTCAYCGKKFHRAPSKIRSEFMFCSRECKDMAQRIESGDVFQEMRPEHYDTNTTTYRAKALRNYEHKCAVCGWDEDVDVLEVHHIDENREHNALDNLIILCPICHKKLTTGKYVLQGRETICLK